MLLRTIVTSRYWNTVAIADEDPAVKFWTRVNFGWSCATALVALSRWPQQPSQPCLAMKLFDLSKSFDLFVRTNAWKAAGRWAEDASIEFFLEKLHRPFATP